MKFQSKSNLSARLSALACVMACISPLSANAKTIDTEIASATLYGKANFGYDSYKLQNEQRSDEITVTRNSNIGMYGSIENNAPIDILFDMRAKYKGTGGFVMDRLLAMVVTDDWSFVIGRAESSYDNITREFDKFDEQFTEDFQVGDLVRDQERITVGRVFGGKYYVAADFAAGNSRANIGDLFAVSTRFDLVDGLEFAAAYEYDEKTNGSRELTVTKRYKAGLNSSFGLRDWEFGYIASFDDYTHPDIEVLTNSVTSSYQYDDQWSVVLGLASKYEYSAEEPNLTIISRVAANYRYSENLSGYFGFAHNNRNDGGRGNNDFMHTAGMTFSF
ncbi:exported hypothetical protein [Vibrio chagasii]|nr:exported hypothetical protein [Vibrio chagasii]